MDCILENELTVALDSSRCELVENVSMNTRVVTHQLLQTTKRVEKAKACSQLQGFVIVSKMSKREYTASSSRFVLRPCAHCIRSSTVKHIIRMPSSACTAIPVIS